MKQCAIITGALGGIGGFGYDMQGGNGGDGGQGLSAESAGQNVAQILGCTQLRCRMALEAEHRLVRRHSASVVDDLDQGPSRILDHDRDLVSICIDCIFHELLHHGCRSLDDLSRGDHVRYVAW